jgi:hypothetical protein
VAFTKVLKYIIFEFTPPQFSFISSFPHSRNSFKRNHFKLGVFKHGSLEFYRIALFWGCRGGWKKGTDQAPRE